MSGFPSLPPARRHVFAVPHSDDETIGMAGHVALALRAKSEVVLALLTASSGRRLAKPHTVAGDDATLTALRWVEFQRAAAALGVRDVRRYGLAEDDLEVVDLADAMADALGAVAGDGDAVLHVTAGSVDWFGTGRTTHPAHVATARAGLLLAKRVPVVAHYVYRYRHAVEVRHEGIPWVVGLDHAAMKAKKAACVPHVYGRASVPGLFAAAEVDPREFAAPIEVAV